MSFFDLFRSRNTLEDVMACRDAGGIILDVRTLGEYNSGHIPGSINLPVDDIKKAGRYIKKPDTPVCVYCLSGSRAAFATRRLRSMGYTNVSNIGAIKHYKGKIER